MTYQYLEAMPHNNLPNPKFFLLAFVIFLAIFLLVFMSFARAEEAYSDESVADAIYLAEGGKQAKVPYGILSVKVKDGREARQVCLNTIRNQRKRHANHKCGLTFLECLARRYAPTQGKNLTNKEKNLNHNWLHNVRYFLRKNASKNP